MLTTLFGSQTARSSFLCFCPSLYSAACGEIQRHLGRINGVIAVLSPNLQLHLHNTQAGTSKDFYPRPPRGGRRLKVLNSLLLLQNFYPRPPRGGRPFFVASSSSQVYFYPRPPRGGRHGLEQLSVLPSEFLSTPCARRATRGAVSRQH